MPGQLNLFKGKRQRGTQLPPPLEFADCCRLADTIDLCIAPGWKWTHLPFGEHREHTVNPKTGKRYSLTGQRLKRLGTKKGWPDYLFTGPQRAAFFLEMKRRKGGRLSDEQIEVGEHLTACGFDYLVLHDVDDAIRELVKRRILRSLEVQ
jgi:hypothetical protein